MLVKKIYAGNLGNYTAQDSLTVTLHISETEASSEPFQTAKMELFAKIKKLFSQKTPS